MAQVRRGCTGPTVKCAQAAGMVSAQAGCSVDTAVILLEQRAALIGCQVGDLAAAVTKRRLRFDIP